MRELVGQKTTLESSTMEKYFNLIEHAADGIAIIQDGVFKLVNSALVHMSGYDKEELLGMPFIRLLTPESRNFVMARYQARLAGKEVPFIYEAKAVTKDGEVRDIEINATLTEYEGHPADEVIIRDITERKRAEEQSIRLSNAIRMSTDSIVISDLEGKIIDINEATLEMYGTDDKRELIGKSSFELIAPEEREKALEGMREVLEKGYVKDREYHITTKGGGNILVEMSSAIIKDADGKPIGFVGVSRDITERKRAEEALRESEENLRTYLESAPDGVYINDLRGKFLYGNKKAEEIMGYKREELIGKSFLKLNILPAKYLPKAGKLLALNAIGKATGPDEFELIRKDGSSIWTEITTTPIKQGGRVVVIGFVRDITERKRVEEALSEANARLQVLQQVTAAIHSTLDLGKVFKQITDRVVYSMGYTTALILTLNDEKKHFEIRTISTRKRLLSQINKILGFSLSNFSVPADPQLNTVLGSVMKGGEVAVTKTLAEIAYPLIGKKTCSALQKLGRTKNCIVVPFNTEEGIIGALFITSAREEVSKEELTMVQNFAVAASQAIRNANLHTQTKQAEEMFQTLANSSPVGVYIVQDGKCRYVNPQVQRYTGYSEDELVGEDTLKLAIPEDRNMVRENAVEMLKGKRSSPYEFRITNKTGETRWVMETVTSIHYQGRRATLGNYVDITERKQAEEKEKRLQQELNLAGRLASIGQMASGIAHEINNPLTGVIGLAQLLMNKDIPDDIKNDLEVINNEAQRVAKIVAGLLTFARQRSPGREYVDINNLVSRVLELRSYEMKVNNIEVETQLAPDLPQTMADVNQLQQVFLNIILNAENEMTAAHNRGKVLIKTEKIGDSIRASFTDDGPGISQENLDKIFNPFFTTREVGDGTGLGLSICHGIITQHKGRIYAESEPGKGATFVVELPIVADTGQMEKPQVIEEEPREKEKAKVLVVDDEKPILDFLKRLLTEQGFEVVTTDRAQAAMKRLHTEKYDLVLLDIKLPIMSVIELYRHIEATEPALEQRVVFITGDVMETTTRDFLDKTKVPYIAKPFNIEQLNKEINRILTRGM